MKTFLKIFLINILLFCGMNYVNASDYLILHGICGEAENVDDGCISVKDQEEFYITMPNKNHIYMISFDKWRATTEDFQTAVITINPGSLSMDNVNYYSDNYDVVRNGNTFNLTRKSGSTDSSGGVYFSFVTPNPTQTGFNQSRITSSLVVKDSSGNTVINENKVSNIYTYLKGQNSYDDNANVASINISDGTLSPAFSKTGSAYNITTDKDNLTLDIKLESGKSKLYYLGYSVNEVDVESYMNNPLETTGPKQFKIDYGTTAIIYQIATEKGLKSGSADSIVLPSENTMCLHNACDELYEKEPNSSRLLAINIIRNDNRSNVNTLKTLTLSDATINFKPDLKIYNVTVPNDVKSITVSSTLTDPKSSYVKGYTNREVSLVEGTNNILIKVKSETGKENTYTIIVTREKSNDNKLTEITVNDKKIKVNEEDLKYEVNVNYDVEKVEVSAIPSHEKAQVEISQLEKLVEGDNEILITVTAPNGEIKVYSLNVKRDKEISSNSKLEYVKVNGYNIDFSSNVTKYTLKINDEKELNLDVKCEHEKAKYVISGNKNLENGSVIKIKVTAEDLTETTYEIKIEKEEKKSGFPIVIPIVIVGLAVLGYVIYLVLKKSNKKVSHLESAEVVESIDGEKVETVNETTEETNSPTEIKNE